MTLIESLVGLKIVVYTHKTRHRNEIATSNDIKLWKVNFKMSKKHLFKFIDRRFIQQIHFLDLIKMLMTLKEFSILFQSSTIV